MRASRAGFVLLSLPLSGCWALFWDVGSACEGDPLVADGEVTIDGEARTAGTSGLFVDVGSDGGCVYQVSGTLDLGQGCALYLEAERTTASDASNGAVAVYDGSLSGEDGCGLEGGAEITSFGASRFEVDAAIDETDSANTFCVDGALTVVIDLTVTNGERSVPLTGEVVLTGVTAAGVDSRACG